MIIILFLCCMLAIGSVYGAKKGFLFSLKITICILSSCILSVFICRAANNILKNIRPNEQTIPVFNSYTNYTYQPSGENITHPTHCIIVFSVIALSIFIFSILACNILLKNKKTTQKEPDSKLLGAALGCFSAFLLTVIITSPYCTAKTLLNNKECDNQNITINTQSNVEERLHYTFGSKILNIISRDI